MSKFVFLILAATIFASDSEHQNTATNRIFTSRAEKIEEKIDFFRWLEKHTYGHRNFENNLVRNRMIAAVNPSKESFVEHFKHSSFNVLKQKGVVLSHGYYFDRVVGIYLLEKVIYKEKYNFIAAPEVVVFLFDWKNVAEIGWLVPFGPAFAMEYIHGVSPLYIGPKYGKKTINKEQRSEMIHLLKLHYVDYVHTKNGPNFLFDQKKIVCIDTERQNFQNIDKLGGYLHHQKIQTILVKTDIIKRHDESKKIDESSKTEIRLPRIKILHQSNDSKNIHSLSENWNIK